MKDAVNYISQAINIDLPSIEKQLIEKEKFIQTCQDYVDTQNGKITPLTFVVYLRKHGFPLVAKSITIFLFNTAPERLTRTLAA